jgi:mannose/cellobiose epimerase-like protein (N-acyl-D-glucosamine 2-epimerase family)
MMLPDHDDPRAPVAALHAKLIGWLTSEAYPRWARYGVESNGAFFESLGPDGLGIPDPRRARVQPRQVFAFAQAPASCAGESTTSRRIIGAATVCTELW